MGNERRGWARKVLASVLWSFLIPVAVLAFAALLIPKTHKHHPALECMNDLRQIGGHLAMQEHRGEDIFAHSGSRFILQIAPMVKDDDLKVFICYKDDRHGNLLSWENIDALPQLYREDWPTAPCSYRGPDDELLARLRIDPDPDVPVIIACDMNGPDGLQPQHPTGVCCLWSNSKVTFVEWKDMVGSDRFPVVVPVPVGPNSPDLRFRHLVP